MAWQLEITVLDVGAGDSSLIIATDVQAGQQAVKRASMLVDGGLTSSALLVHNAVIKARLPKLDTILVSHYDIDHSVGAAALLLADNLWHLCDLITQIAVQDPLPANGIPAEQTVARIAALAAAAALGATKAQADGFGSTAARDVPSGSVNADAADFGVRQLDGQSFAGTTLIPGATLRRNAAVQAACAAMGIISTGIATVQMVQAATRSALYGTLRNDTRVPPFETGGIYLRTRIIDVGTAVKPPEQYLLAVSGRVNFHGRGNQVRVPGVNRQRVVPPLGSEVLWGPGMPPDANAPVAIVIAKAGTGWQGTNPPRAPVGFQGGTMSNLVSIGMVLVFGQFAHFTAGDLPYQGEDPIGDALVGNNAQRLPDGNGGYFGKLSRIVNLKCSHHGSAASTSDQFVSTIKPWTAVISCGHKNNHPAQRVVDTLNQSIETKFWLTNCNYERNHVPFSTKTPLGPGNQLTTPGNRAFVAGDNKQDNMAVGRNRGDVKLKVMQKDVAMTVQPWKRTYTVEYWEQSGLPPGSRTVTLVW